MFYHKKTNEKDEYGNFKTINIYTPLSKQQFNKIEQQRKTQGYYVGQFSGIIKINESGWHLDDGGSFNSLSFNKKNKSISCSYGM